MAGRPWLLVLLTLATTGCAAPVWREPPCQPPPVDVHGVPGAHADGDADGDAGLRVVEHGFSTLADARDPEHQFVSFGALLENAGDRVAYRTRVRLVLRDSQGRDVTAVAHPGADRWFGIPVILPGQRLGFGQWRRLARFDADGRYIRVVEVSLEFGATTWVLPHRELFQPMPARALAVELDDPTWTGATIRYEAVSPHCWTLRHQGIAVVFRGPTGAIVGGSHVDLGECRSGTRTGSGAAIGVPRGATAELTEVYPYCDVAAPSLDPLLFRPEPGLTS